MLSSSMLNTFRHYFIITIAELHKDNINRKQNADSNWFVNQRLQNQPSSSLAEQWLWPSHIFLVWYLLLPKWAGIMRMITATKNCFGSRTNNFRIALGTRFNQTISNCHQRSRVLEECIKALWHKQTHFKVNTAKQNRHFTHLGSLQRLCSLYLRCHKRDFQYLLSTFLIPDCNLLTASLLPSTGANCTRHDWNNSMKSKWIWTVHSIISSSTFSQMQVALHCACYPLLQTDKRFVAQVLFGTITAVVVVGSCQGHSHRCKGWFEGHYRAQDHG